MKEKEKIKSSKTIIRLVLTIILTVISLVACSLIIVFYMTGVNGFIKTIADTGLDRTSVKVSNWVETKKTIVNDAEKAVITFLDQPDRVQLYFANLRESNPGVVTIYFGTLASKSKGGYFIDSQGWQPPDEYGWTTRPWFKDAVATEQIAITEPYRDFIDEDFEKDSGGKFVISISKIVMDGNEIIGVISADIFADTLAPIVNNAYLTENSELYLINKKGDYIIHEDESKIGELNLFVETPELVENRNKILSGEFFLNNKISDSGYFASRMVYNTDWILIARGNNSDFHDTTGTIITLSLILFLLAAIFITLLARSWFSYNRLVKATNLIDKQNQELETKVTERTSSLKSILDNTGQGFFTFADNYQITKGVSKGCHEIFDQEIEGLFVYDILFSGNKELGEEFRQGFDLYFSGKAKAEIIFDLTEKQIIINGKIIAIDYKEIAGSKILCIMTDITLETKLAERNKKEKIRHQRIIKVINHKNFFSDYTAEADEIFSLLDIYISTPPDDKQTDLLLQLIHTFKGNSGFFGFNETQESAHDSELTISDSKILQSEFSYRDISINLKKAYYKELRVITETMGESWIDEVSGIIIPRDSYYKIVNYVRSKLKAEKKLVYYLEYYRKIPFKDIFSRLPFIADATASKLGKKIEPMKISGGDIRVVPDIYRPFAETCIHLVNNMIDHGIEFPYERETVQKFPTGNIELVINTDKTHFILEFKDDGKGINMKEIEVKAKEKGLIPEESSLSNSELLKILFADGFSSKSEASIVSGRGIGLAAVRQEVEKLGGTIEARSRIGKGSIFEIVLPLKTH